MIRNSHKLGDHLFQDDITGFVHYASEARKTWDGLLVHKDVWAVHQRNPQEFVRARLESDVVRDTRKPAPLAQDCAYTPAFIGTTTIRTPLSGPGAQVFAAGIGDAEIGCSFVVR